MSGRLTDGIKTLYGVGPAKVAAYERLGISTLGDLLYHFPRAYENRGDVHLLSEAPENCRTAVVLTVGTEPKSTRIRGRMSLLKFRAFDESGICEITFYNQEYLKSRFVLGSTFRFWGKVQKKGKKYVMTAPESEPYTEDTPLPDLLPVYRLSQGLTPKLVSGNVAAVLAQTALLEDPLPDEIRIENRLATLGFALNNIHNPTDYVSLARAKRRLIFDEFFIFALGLSLTKKSAKQTGAPICDKGNISRLTATLPYELTGAQKRVIAEIRADMAHDVPMSRIVVGDVGCGKTVCAAAAMLIAVQSGRQAALMAPTELLARQHYDDLAPIFKGLGIRAALLIGATTAASKRKIREALTTENPADRLDVVIGTQALLSDGVEFAAPGLIVTDEQHRFGVRQRATLQEKNAHAHMLVMSATPIPRSLALALWGDLALSRIDEMPAGRQRVDTFVVDEGYRARLHAFIRKTCAEGGQVYVVCPAVEERDAEIDELMLSEIGEYAPLEKTLPPMKAAVTHAEDLRAALPDLSIAVVHGAMKSREKEAVMQAFAAGEVQVLVSTTVIEVGVNVPNASLMIVENAERFGLSQLHQLRGRVGRGKRKSYCVLVSDALTTPESTAASRLATMKTTYDGFEIAEKDLALRGPGDFLSGATGDAIRQSGGVKFRLAALCDDTGLLTAAFTEAKKLAEKDPELTNYPTLRQTVDTMFTLDSDTIS
ncbi:MAG: ATP-dependent DNA helicase RecG [Clostridia bacterium]|nr:ATP-dependent DNA helicase RecG [Clostridia bacterium]